MNKLKLIKFIVAILTFLIIFGMLSALGMIYKKTRPASLPQTTINLSQPRGTNIKNFSVVGNNIYIHTKKKGQPDRIIILDTTNPQHPTTITLD